MSTEAQVIKQSRVGKRPIPIPKGVTVMVDAGAIFGTGFAPFHGGPLHYAETLAQAPA